MAEWMSTHAREWFAGLGQSTMSAAAGVGGALLSFALIAVATFLLLRHSDALIETIQDLLPSSGREAKNCCFGSAMSSMRACTGS